MNLDWDDLRLLLKIAEAGSMTAASRTLMVSQPTLGRRLKDLEEQLGAKLFERFPNHLEVTPFGSQILGHARRMEAATVDIARAADLRRETGDTVHISATTSVAIFLVERLHRLAALAETDHVVIAVSTTRAMVDLARREADVALRMRSAPEGGNLKTRRVARVAFGLYRHAEQAPKSADATGEAFIGLTDDRPPPQRPWLDHYAESVGGRIVHRLGEVFMRHRAIRAGLGISLLPCFVGDRDTELVRFADPADELDEDVHLLLHQDVVASGAVARVAKGLRLLFKEDEALLAGKLPNRPPQ